MKFEPFKFFCNAFGIKHIRQDIVRAQRSLLYSGKTDTGMQPKVGVRTKCPECGSPRVARTFEETVCVKCGLVLEDTVFVSGRMG